MCTFSSLSLDAMQVWHEQLFSGKSVAGLIAFPLPLQEVDIEAPIATTPGGRENRPASERVRRLHIRPMPSGRSLHLRKLSKTECGFPGMKPYFDLLGKSVFDFAHLRIRPGSVVGVHESRASDSDAAYFARWDGRLRESRLLAGCHGEIPSRHHHPGSHGSLRGSGGVFPFLRLRPARIPRCSIWRRPRQAERKRTRESGLFPRYLAAFCSGRTCRSV